MSDFFELIKPDDARSYDVPSMIVVGIITDVNDPKNAHRIKVRVPTIDPNAAFYPNGDEGWVQYAVPFTVNNHPGGAAFPLEVGTEVLLVPVNGDMRRLIAVGCLPNYVDKLYHEFNPAQGKYGTATRGGTIDVADDKVGTRTTAYPTGIIEDHSADGSLTIQTQGQGQEQGGQGTSHLRLDAKGTVAIGNEKAGTVFGSQGEVEITSAFGSSIEMNESGQLSISSQRQASLIVGERVELNSSPPTVDVDVHAIESLLSFGLQELSDRLLSAKAIAQQFFVDYEDENRVIVYGDTHQDLIFKLFVDLGEVFALVDLSVDKFPQMLEKLDILKNYALKDYVQMLRPQVEEGLRINLDGLAECVDSSLGENFTDFEINEFIADLWENLPDDYLEELSPDESDRIKEDIRRSEKILKALNHDKDLMVDFVLANLAPNGWESIESLVGLGVHKKIREIELALNPDVAEIYRGSKEEEIEYAETFEERLRNAIALLPSDLQSYLAGDFEQVFRYNPGTEDNTESEISLAYHGSILQRLWGCDRASESTSEPGTEAKFSNLYKFQGQRRDDGIESGEGTGLADGQDIDWEELELMMLVPGQSPLPVLFGFIFLKLIEEGYERAVSLNETPDVLGKIRVLIDFLGLLKEDEIVAEGNRERIEEGVELVGETFGISAEIDFENDSIERVVEIAGAKVLPEGAIALEESVRPVLENAIGDFSRLLNAIPSHSTGSSLKIENQEVKISAGAGERGAGINLQPYSANIFGPRFSPEADNQTFMTLGKLDAIVGAGGVLGPTLQMNPRTAEILGAAHFGDENVDEPDESDDAPQLNKPQKQSGDASRSWSRPEKEVSYEKTKFGGIRPTPKSLHLMKGGTKVKKEQSAIAPESDNCLIRPSVSLERTGAVVTRSGISGAATIVNRTHAEMFGPEVKDPQGNTFRTSFFAFEEEVGGMAGSHGGAFFAGTQLTQFLAPERGSGEMAEGDEDEHYNQNGIDLVNHPGIRVTESGEVEETHDHTPTEGRERLRAGLFADKSGTFGGFSGGSGAAWIGNNEVFEIIGPETNSDRSGGSGERFRQIVSKHTIAQQAGSNGAISFLTQDMNKILSPKKEDGTRSFVQAKIDELISSAGGDGAVSELTNLAATLRSPGGVNDLVMDRVKTHINSPGGELLLQAGSSILSGNGFSLNMSGGMADIQSLGQTIGTISPSLTSFTSEAINFMGGGTAGTIVNVLSGGMSIDGEFLENLIMRVVSQLLGGLF